MFAELITAAERAEPMAAPPGRPSPRLPSEAALVAWLDEMGHRPMRPAAARIRAILTRARAAIQASGVS